MGGRHDRPKVVCAPDRDLARARGTVLRPPSAVSSFGGFRTPAAEHAATSLKRPASETLHNSGRPDKDANDPQADIPCDERSIAMLVSSSPTPIFCTSAWTGRRTWLQAYPSAKAPHRDCRRAAWRI